MFSSPEDRLKALAMAGRLLATNTRDSIGRELELAGWGDEASGRIDVEDVDEKDLVRWKQLLVACETLEGTLGFSAPPQEYPVLAAKVQRLLNEGD